MSDQTQIAGLMRQAAEAYEAGALEASDGLCRRVLAVDPSHHPATRLRVRIASQAGRHADALAILDAAAGADPGDPAWPFGRGLILTSLGRHAAAVAAFDLAIALSPPDHDIHRPRAQALFADNQFAAALAGFDAAIEARPDAADIHIDRGGALQRLRRHDDALVAYDRAIELRPDDAPAHYARALLLLLRGRYHEGWAAHEWRWFTPNYPEPEHLFRQPLWDGTPLAGRTLLVHAEQGLGDSIQFYRFVPQARRQGPVVVFVPPKLARLFETQPNAPTIVTRSDRLPAFDLHCPMLSLPLLLGCALDTIPAAPYLWADPGIAAGWRVRLPRSPGRFRIGIVWAGNKAQENDRYRSMPLATMLAMLDPDATIVSLQKDVPESDRATLREATHVLDLSEGLTDFADTAAVISQLDLVITVCTSVAHLAGALGAPVWVLLSGAADWRWLLDRSDSPWYASARLFRQDRLEDWTGVAREVRDALKGMAVSA